MSAIAHVDHECGTRVHVFPPEFFAVIGNVAGTAEGEAQMAEQVVGLESEGGERFAVADVDGVFTCPVCQNPGRVPLIDLN